MSAHWDVYFDKTLPEEYSLLSFYQYRQQQEDFTFSFQKEAGRLRKNLDLLVKEGSEEKKSYTNRLLQNFENHRSKNVEIDRLWNEVERESLEIEHVKEKKQLQLDQVKIARVMAKGTEEGVENIMKNVNKELDDSGTDEGSEPYLLRKRPRVDYNEDRISKRQEQEDEYNSPTPSSPKSHQLPMDNLSMGGPFFEEGVEDYPIIINDIPDELSFKDEDSIDDLKIREINVSRLFHQYQNESVKIAKTGGLFVESNMHEILSLSSIFLLNPGSYSKMMIDIFSSSLLDDIYQQANPPQQIELDTECELKLRKVIKKAIKESRCSATKLLLTELTNDQMLNENLGSMILECLKKLPTTKIKNEPSETTLITNYLDHIMREILHDPDKHVVEWPNTEINESKARKPQGIRNKQPDFTVSIVHQLQLSGVIFVGEVSPPSGKNNVFKNCNDLIRVGVFMKGCLDSAIELGADIKILGFQCVDYTVEFYMMDLVRGMYIMINIGKLTIPASLREVSNFVDDLEILLAIRKVFQESFNVFFDKLCNPSSSSTKMKFKRDTLGTPKFRKLVNKTHNCHRSCPFWFGRF